MKKEHFKTLVIGSIILFILIWFGIESTTDVVNPGETIYLAFVGPESESEGKSFIQGIRMYFDEVNAKGGVNGRKLDLDTYDDGNNTKLANEKAIEVINKNRAVAVIGHFYSSTSIQGGKIYQRYGIPAVTPGATSDDVTKNNPWYFRTVFNDKLQGRFLANYLKKVLHQDIVSVIHHGDAYGTYLADVFTKAAVELGIEVKYTYAFNKKNLDTSVREITADLKTKVDAGMLFLATYSNEGTQLIKSMRDAEIKNQLVVPAAYVSKSFIDSFKKFPREKNHPGFYTDDIYITTPLIFDTANEKAQIFRSDYYEKYGEEADIRAAFGYDTAMVLVEAIKNTQAQGKKNTLTDDRQKIKNYLASIDDSANAVEGVTGFNYFDQNGDAQKPVAIGVFKNRNIISALVQLQDVRSVSEIDNLAKAIADGRVILIDNKHMYKTNVIYVGIKTNEVSEFDEKNLSYDLDFNLWFRYRGNIDPHTIAFSNAVEPIKLGGGSGISIFNKGNNFAESLTQESSTNAKFNYQLYEVKGKFKADFFSGKAKKAKPDEHILGINFHHKDLTRNNLIYVTDVLGMGITEEEKMVDKLQKNHVLNPTINWAVKDAWFFQDVYKENSLGNPKFLNIPGGKVEYSQFNMGILIENSRFTLRRLMEPDTADKILLISGILILLLRLIAKHQELRHFSKTIWFLHAIFSFLMLLSSEVILVTWILKSGEDPVNTSFLNFVFESFDVLWWIIPAILLHLAVELFLWRPLEERSGRKIPRIGRRFVSFSIYMLTSLAIVAFVYDQKLTSLLATSGVIAMIIGLAIQINISNIFSGIAINIEHPFRVGDWVQIGNFEEGKVVDITWRTTRIITREGCILSIPNSMAAESPINNFDYPDDSFWLRFIVHIHPAHPPERVQKIIRDAVISTEVVLKVPEPYVIFRGISDWAADYLVYCAVRDYTWRLLHEQAVWTRVWTHLNRVGIAPAIQRQEIHLFRGVKERGEEAATKPSTLLGEVDLFRPFSDEAKQTLSDNIRSHRLSMGEIIVRQGDVGNSLFIIVEGVVGVRVQSTEGEQVEVARLGAGNFFGEMALLTGEDRTATVIAITDVHLYEITKEDLAPLMEEQLEVLERISKILTQRQMMTKSQMHVQHDPQIEEEVLYNRFRNKIESFFGLKQMNEI